MARPSPNGGKQRVGARAWAPDVGGRPAGLLLPEGIADAAGWLRGLVAQWAAAEVAPGRLIPWLPVAFGLGIVGYFTADREPAWWATSMLALAGIAVAVLARRRPFGFPLALGFAAFALGLAMATLQTMRIKHPILQNSMASVSLAGFVEIREEREKSDRFWEDHRRRLFGEETVFHNEKGEFLSPAEHARVTELDVRWMIEQARARSIPFVAITYPFPAALFTAPNEGIRKATAAYGAAVVEAKDASARLVDEYRARGEKPPPLYDETLHPTQFFYDAIGDLVLEKLDERGYL
jgi:hypothetical protein